MKEIRLTASTHKTSCFVLWSLQSAFCARYRVQSVATTVYVGRTRVRGYRPMGGSCTLDPRWSGSGIESCYDRRGLCVQMNPRAMLAGAQAPSRATQARPDEGEGLDEAMQSFSFLPSSLTTFVLSFPFFLALSLCFLVSLLLYNRLSIFADWL